MDSALIAQEYRHKSAEELLRLAAEPQDLTPEAHEILKAELASRGIAQDTLSKFRAQVEEEKDEAAKDPGKLFCVYHYGVGRTTFGKARRTYDPQTRIERFKTTVFIVLF